MGKQHRFLNVEIILYTKFPVTATKYSRYMLSLIVIFLCSSKKVVPAKTIY